MPIFWKRAAKISAILFSLAILSWGSVFTLIWIGSSALPEEMSESLSFESAPEEPTPPMDPMEELQKLDELKQEALAEPGPPPMGE